MSARRRHKWATSRLRTELDPVNSGVEVRVYVCSRVGCPAELGLRDAPFGERFRAKAGDEWSRSRPECVDATVKDGGAP